MKRGHARENARNCVNFHPTVRPPAPVAASGAEARRLAELGLTVRVCAFTPNAHEIGSGRAGERA